MNKLKANRILILSLFIFFVHGLVIVNQAQDKLPTSYFPLISEANGKIQARKWDEAEQLLKKAVAVNPYRGENWLTLGKIQYQQKEYQAAVSSFLKALELRAGVPYYSAYYIANCYAKLNQQENAISWLRKAFSMGFGSLDELREDPDLNILHDDPRYQKIAGLLPQKKLSRTEGRIFDLNLLLREINRVHYAPYRNISQSKFSALAQQLKKDIPGLTDNQFLVRVLQLMVLLGDGHTHAFMDFHTPGKFFQIPLRLYFFEEGLFIIAASREYAGLIGSRVISINNHNIDEVTKAVKTISSHDNEFEIMETGPQWMTYPQPLNGLGLIPTDKEVSYQLQDQNGQTKTVTLTSVTEQPARDKWVELYQQSAPPIPLYLKNLQAKFWYEYLPEQKTVYFQFNQVFNEKNETFQAFVERLFKFIDENGVERLIIDMRWNNGGNGYLARHLLTAIIRHDKINQHGNLFVIVGRKTFSAAMITAGQIERNTNAIFVGERTGTSPNFVGEDNHFTLPYTKFDISLSNVYHQNSYGNDYRMWIAPEIYTPPTFEFYRTNRDPALEAILQMIRSPQ